MFLTNQELFVNQIGKKGSGPGEYILLSSFFVDNNKNYIAAIDVAQDKVLYYNATDFSFCTKGDYLLVHLAVYS